MGHNPAQSILPSCIAPPGIGPGALRAPRALYRNPATGRDPCGCVALSTPEPYPPGSFLSRRLSVLRTRYARVWRALSGRKGVRSLRPMITRPSPLCGRIVYRLWLCIHQDLMRPAMQVTAIIASGRSHIFSTFVHPCALPHQFGCLECDVAKPSATNLAEKIAAETGVVIPIQ